MQRLNQSVSRFGEIDVVVPLHGLIEKRQPQQQRQPEQQEQRALLYSGFHRNTGLRAAVTSSTRLVRVP